MILKTKGKKKDTVTTVPQSKLNIANAYCLAYYTYNQKG
jgi:hypothetical protein